MGGLIHRVQLRDDRAPEQSGRQAARSEAAERHFPRRPLLGGNTQGPRRCAGSPRSDRAAASARDARTHRNCPHDLHRLPDSDQQDSLLLRASAGGSATYLHRQGHPRFCNQHARWNLRGDAAADTGRTDKERHHGAGHRTDNSRRRDRLRSAIRPQLCTPDRQHSRRDGTGSRTGSHRPAQRFVGR